MGYGNKGKSTAGALALRREEVMEMILDNKRTSTIIKQIRSEYNISQNSVEKDLQHSYDLIKKNRPDVEELITIHLKKYDRIAERASEEYDNGMVLKALQAKEKLLKLWSPTEVQVNVQNNTVNVESLTLEQIEKLLNATN